MLDLAVLARSRAWERYPKCSGSTVPYAIERKRLSIESTGMTGKGDTTDGLQYPMVDLFTGGTMLPLMFVNAAATCYLLSLTAPLAFMAAWTKVLEVSIPPTAWPPNLPGVKMQRTSPHDRF